MHTAPGRTGARRRPGARFRGARGPCRAELRGAVAAEWLAEALPPSGLQTECGATGGLSFQPVLPERYTLAIRGDGITPFDRPKVSPKPGETLDLGVLRVPAMDVLPVVVRDEQKRPVAEAQIVAIADAGLMVRREAMTDAEGKARITGLPVRGTISLGIDAAGFAPWRREELTARDAPVIATLERGAQVEGRVVDPWGNPVGGARVVANPQREDMIRLDAPPPESVSAEDGTFAMRSLDAGVVTLVADARGFEKSNVLALTLAAGDVHRGATLTLRPVRDVRGRVLDPRGAPSPGRASPRRSGSWSATCSPRRPCPRRCPGQPASSCCRASRAVTWRSLRSRPGTGPPPSGSASWRRGSRSSCSFSRRPPCGSSVPRDTPRSVACGSRMAPA